VLNQNQKHSEPPTVAVMETSDGFNGTQAILELINTSHYFSTDDKIMLKVCYPFIPKSKDSWTVLRGDISTSRWSVGTHPTILAGALEYLINKLGIPKENITVGEGSRRGAYQENFTFPFFEGDVVVKRYGVSITDLNIGERFYDSPYPKPLSTKNDWSVHHSVRDYKILLLPKLRAHDYVTFTCAMKNFMAFIMPRNIVHADIHRRIVDLNTLPSVNVPLIVADAIHSGVSNEQYELEPVKYNLLVAGNYTASVDAVIAYLLGMEPEKIGFLRHAKKRGFVIDIDKISVITQDNRLLDSFKREFTPREELVDGCRVAEFLEENPEYEKDYGSTVVESKEG